MKIQKSITLGTMVCCLAGCTQYRTQEKADMTGYEGLSDKMNHSFIACNTSTFLDLVSNDETFVAYFGFTECPYCNSVIDILDETAKEYGTEVYYIDTRANGEENNTEIPRYDEVVEVIGDNLALDDDGVKHLYVPTVFFVKGGEVKGSVGIIYAKEGDEIIVQGEEQKTLYEDGFEILGLIKKK